MLNEMEELVQCPGDILYRGEGEDRIQKGDEVYLYREDRISVCAKILNAQNGKLTGIVTKINFGEKDFVNGLKIGDKVTTREKYVFMVSHQKAA